jgi:DNA-binding transcriptional MocR family regulator
MRLKQQPRYRYIARVIRDRILSGQYKPGEKIPPIRRLAEQFNCNKLTVQRSLEILKQESILENKIGSGTYVRFPQKIHEPAGLFDFRTDYLHESLFAYQWVQNICNDLFRHEKGHALAPTPVEGDPELLRVLSRSYHLPAERMLVISGAQQGLDLVSKVFSAKISESILFEDPTYPGAISLFKARHFVPLKKDGPDLGILDTQLTDQIKLLYTMPAVHNPTGRAYSGEKMKALAHRARQHHFFIIEDDYLGELCPRALRFIDICPEQTIFIKSFAQTTLAGVRLGFMIVPQSLFKKFVYAKFSSDITSFGLLQKFLRELIKQGLYASHLVKVRKLVAQRRRQVEGLLDSFAFLALDPGQDGYSVWVCSNADPDSLHPGQVSWSRGEEFSFRPFFKKYLKLSFMNMDEEIFQQSLLYLNELLTRRSRQV